MPLGSAFHPPKNICFSTLSEPLTLLPYFKCYLGLWGMIKMHVPLQGHLIQGTQCTQCFLVMWTACSCPMNGGRDLRESMQVVGGIYDPSHWQSAKMDLDQRCPTFSQYCWWNFDPCNLMHVKALPNCMLYAMTALTYMYSQSYHYRLWRHWQFNFSLTSLNSNSWWLM